jgi:hypothetical protein
MMDESKRKFIIGMSATCAALSVSAVAGTRLMLKNTHQKISSPGVSLSDGKFSSYDAFSPALIGSALSSLFLNNVEYLYTVLIVFISLFLLFTVGIPGYEYLMPYSQQYFLNY